MCTPECRFPWIPEHQILWSDRQLWATLCGLWEPNLDPLQVEHTLLTTKASLSSDRVSRTMKCCLESWHFLPTQNAPELPSMQQGWWVRVRVGKHRTVTPKVPAQWRSFSHWEIPFLCLEMASAVWTRIPFVLSYTGLLVKRLPFDVTNVARNWLGHNQKWFAMF